MPTKTIYIRNSDKEDWDLAHALAGDKLAPTIMNYLRLYILTRKKELLRRPDGCFCDSCIALKNHSSKVNSGGA